MHLVQSMCMPSSEFWAISGETNNNWSWFVQFLIIIEYNVWTPKGSCN